MAESDPECERDERDREQRHRMRGGGAEQPGRAEAEPEAEDRFVTQPRDNRADEAALDDGAEQPERSEEVAGPRGVETESRRAKQRERRLEHREREPVDEVDGK